MAGGKSSGVTAGSKYFGSSKVTPKDPHKQRGLPPPSEYPATVTFASQPTETNGLVEAGRKARRPGGKLRGSGPWKTSTC